MELNKEQMEKKWEDFTMEPRSEAWHKLESKLEDHRGDLSIRSKMRWNVWMAAASFLLVIGASVFVTQKLQVSDNHNVTKVYYMDASYQPESFSTADIYKRANQIVEGSDGVQLRVKI